MLSLSYENDLHYVCFQVNENKLNKHTSDQLAYFSYVELTKSLWIRVMPKPSINF